MAMREKCEFFFFQNDGKKRWESKFDASAAYATYSHPLDHWLHNDFYYFCIFFSIRQRKSPPNECTANEVHSVDATVRRMWEFTQRTLTTASQIRQMRGLNNCNYCSSRIWFWLNIKTIISAVNGRCFFFVWLTLSRYFYLLFFSTGFKLTATHIEWHHFLSHFLVVTIRSYFFRFFSRLIYQRIYFASTRDDPLLNYCWLMARLFNAIRSNCKTSSTFFQFHSLRRAKKNLIQQNETVH